MQYNSNNIKYAKQMRSNMTDAESKLWYYLRAKRFYGLKFKRQVLIGEYIVDFLCKEKNIVIELDGGQHNEDDNIVKDNERTKYLESQGYIVIRYWNNDIMQNIDAVLSDLKDRLDV